VRFALAALRSLPAFAGEKGLPVRASRRILHRMSKAETLYERLQALPDPAQTALLHVVELLAPKDSADKSGEAAPTKLGQQFRDLTDTWKRETRWLSFMEQRAMHPAYQRIIGMGWVAVPLILCELERQPEHWLWALRAITGAEPTGHAETVAAAAHAWLSWGRERGLLADAAG